MRKNHTKEKKMGLYKRKDSKFWQMLFEFNGEEMRMSSKTSNKKIAQRIYDKMKGEIVEGKHFKIIKDNIPFEKLADDFYEKYIKIERQCHEKDRYLGETLKRYFGSKLISDITNFDVTVWRGWKTEHITKKGTKISKAAVNRELAYLKTMFEKAVEWGWLKENPAKNIKLLKGEVERMRIIDKAEISRLIECAAPYLKPIIILAISTGMRRGEILNLKWKDVNFSNGTIWVEKTKNGEPRHVPVTNYLADTLEALEESKKIGQYVFCNEKCKKRSSIRDAFNNACRRAEIIGFRLHDCRHVSASLYANGGYDIISLKYLLGHKTLAMTQRYAHMMPDAQGKARQIMQDFWSPKSNTESNT